MTLTDHNPYRMRFAPFAPLPDDELYVRVGGGRLWLDALSPRANGTSKGPFGRARAYARTAPVTHLVIEPGTIRCWINENTSPAPASRTYVPQPHPTIHIPVLDHGQWRDLTVITRHLADQLARLPAEHVLQELIRTGIRLLPTLDECRASCSCSSRSALCKHAATALLQAARCLDAMPLVLLLLRGRAPVDFFAGLQNADHPSLRSHGLKSLPLPPVTSAQTVFDEWERTARPPLPPVWPLPEQPATPVLPVVGGLDGQIGRYLGAAGCSALLAAERPAHHVRTPRPARLGSRDDFSSPLCPATVHGACGGGGSGGWLAVRRLAGCRSQENRYP